MKKLQNNFTTPEQSKRLLELGVPADSADCYFFQDAKKYDGVPRPFFLFPRTYEFVMDFNAAYGDKVLPCWSVGRLIEIIMICENTGSVLVQSLRGEMCFIDNLITEIEYRIKNTKKRPYLVFDLSELEEWLKTKKNRKNIWED